MGIHLMLLRRGIETAHHPSWDSARFTGDSDFAKLTEILPSNWLRAPFDSPLRPSHFPIWRQHVEERTWPNPGRYSTLLDILQEQPDLWLYISQ